MNLAEEFMLSSDGLVVGVDLSGDPTVCQTVWYYGGFVLIATDPVTLCFTGIVWVYLTHNRNGHRLVL